MLTSKTLMEAKLASQIQTSLTSWLMEYKKMKKQVMWNQLPLLNLLETLLMKANTALKLPSFVIQLSPLPQLM